MDMSLNYCHCFAIKDNKTNDNFEQENLVIIPESSKWLHFLLNGAA